MAASKCGLVVACRNPLLASYMRQNAALGGISMALALGEAIIDAERRGGTAVIDAIFGVSCDHIPADGV